MAIKDSNYQMKSLYLKVYVQTVMDLELFIEMLGIPSTSGEERRFADFLKERLAALDTLLAEQPCFTLKNLAVNGNDLKVFGLKGPALGDALKQLLEAVMDGRVANEKEALNDFVTKFIKI